MMVAFFLGLITILGVPLTTEVTSDTTNTDALVALTDLIIEGYTAAVAEQDAALIVSKYWRGDAIYVRSGREVAHGSAEVLQLFQDWFKLGVNRVEVERIDTGTMGPDYMFLLIKQTCYDNEDEVVESGRNLVIFRLEDGVFKVSLKMQTLEYRRSAEDEQ